MPAAEPPIFPDTKIFLLRLTWCFTAGDSVLWAWPQCVFRFPFSFSWVCVLYSNLAFPSGPLTVNAMVLVSTQASHTLAGEWRE